jgi:gamma-tubulin complex component 3
MGSLEAPLPRVGRAALQPVGLNGPPELPLQPDRAAAKPGGGALQHAHKDAIERLVERVVDVKMTPAQRENLQCYVYRLLGSRIGATGGDEFQLVEKMKRGLAGSGSEGARKAVRFAEVYRRFSQKRVITNRWGIMHMLNVLSNSSSTGAPSAGTSALGLLEQSAVFKAAPPTMPDLAPELEQSLRQLAPGNPRATSLRDHEALRTDSQVPESVLVRDVVFAMQGIDGRLIKFDKSIDGYAVERGQGVPAPTRDLVRRICESGWLYRKVSGAVRNMTENKRSLGMVVQGLAAGLQAELSEYYRLVAVLQAQSVSDVRRLGDKLSQTESVGHRSEDAAQDAAPQPLTLRRLLVWAQEPIARSASHTVQSPIDDGPPYSLASQPLTSRISGAPSARFPPPADVTCVADSR